MMMMMMIVIVIVIVIIIIIIIIRIHFGSSRIDSISVGACHWAQGYRRHGQPPCAGPICSGRVQWLRHTTSSLTLTIRQLPSASHPLAVGHGPYAVPSVL